MEEEKYYEAMAQMQSPGTLGRQLNQAPTSGPSDMRQLILNLHNEVSNLYTDFHTFACDLCGPDHIGGPRLVDQPECIVDGLRNTRATIEHMQTILHSMRNVYFAKVALKAGNLSATAPDPVSASYAKRGLY